MGLFFSVDYNLFGKRGRTKWNTFFKSISQDVINKLVKLGFSDHGNGQVYLPIRLDVAKLASAWSNEDYDEVFNPLINNLNMLLKAKNIFSELLEQAEMTCTP